MQPSGFESDLEKVLCVLGLEKDSGDGFLSAADIANILRERHRENIHWRTVATILDKNPKLASRRKRRNVRQYSILEKGLATLGNTEAAVRLIDPAKALESVVSFHKFLGTLKGVIRLCDPYLDNSTIEHLDACTSVREVRFLTHNITDSGALRRLVNAFDAPTRKLFVRKTAKSVLHDRYLLEDSSMRILGTSLNGLGKKECFVIKAGDDMRATMLSVFDKRWNEGQPWP
jgi:hypothetical protein